MPATPHLPPDDGRMSALLAATAEAERAHFWFRGFRRFVTPMLETAARGRRDLAIVDCGAGTGHNLLLLEPFGSVVGVELNRTGAIVARARGERRMVCGTVTALPLATASVDLATSFDVLYCLPDSAERAALDEMRRVVKPGGRIVINVAANPRLAGEHSALTHEVRRYTRASLAAALDRAGFTTLRATYTNAATFPIVATVRALQRRGLMRGSGDRARDIETPAAPINAALTAALAVEARLLRLVDMPFGSSLLALAERD
ncbi:MAG TPA: class I SAM-dependent methyltransferase [Vicinamibacterales bacterium]